MNCEKCGTKMKLLKLPSETHYQSTSLRRMFVCPKCGFEKEFKGREKSQ